MSATLGMKAVLVRRLLLIAVTVVAVAAGSEHALVSGATRAADSRGWITWQSWRNGADPRWFTVREDGSGYRELMRGRRWADSRVDVSPNGRQAAGSSVDGIWTARLDGSARRLIVRIRGAHTVTWSPNGREIAFVRNFDDENQVRLWQRDIYVAHSDGTARRRVAVAYGYTDEPVSWSPDGRRILISSKRRLMDVNATLYAVDVGTGTRTSLGRGESPSYSPDGRHVAFTVKKSFESLGQLAFANPRGRERRLLQVVWLSGSPVWSSNSTEVVGSGYTINGLVVVRVDGERRRIAPLSGDVLWLDWAD